MPKKRMGTAPITMSAKPSWKVASETTRRREAAASCTACKRRCALALSATKLLRSLEPPTEESAGGCTRRSDLPRCDSIAPFFCTASTTSRSWMRRSCTPW